MEDVIKEYSEAVKANIDASKAVVDANVLKRAAHYRLMKARDALRSKEKDLLEDCENHLLI